MSAQNTDNSNNVEAVGNLIGNVNAQDAAETNTSEHEEVLDQEMRNQLKLKEKNLQYLRVLNERLEKQEIKLQKQQVSIEDNHILEERLRRYISKQRHEYGKHWQTVYNLKLQILQEIQIELESSQQPNGNAGSTQQSQIPPQQIIPPATTLSYHQESNPLLRQLLTNHNQAYIPTDLARLNSLANLRHRLEADIHIQQQTQHETNEILRNSRELLRMQRQQFRILRQEIEQNTAADSTLV